MRYLLDTHTLLWLATDSPRLSPTVIEIFQSPHSEALLSVASLWEIAIKVSMGRLDLGGDYATAMAYHLQKAQVELIAITFIHCTIAASLPFYYRDPFDRMLVAQALSEQIPLISADSTLGAYGIEQIW